MKIGIDITPIIYGRGVSRYTSNLVEVLNKRSSAEVCVFGYSLRRRQILENFIQKNKLKNFSLHSLPPSIMGSLWRMGQNKVKRHLPQIELFHSWDWIQPPDQDLPLVSTIHDVSMIKFPETAHSGILRAHQRSWKILKERQAQIIAVSQASKKDIINLLGIPHYQVQVVHEALPNELKITSQFLGEEKAEHIKDKLHLTRPYLLFVGTREPRKNLARLIEAWKPLANDYQLIVAGEKGWDKSEQIQHPNLRFLGQVNDGELIVLYAEAEVFCYPSLYEGFGLPILEAFFHGAPVVTSNVSSMPEVAGNAAELVNPESVESIRQGITTILNEPLEEQKKRLQRMIIRLQMFSWDRVADETIEVYKKAIQSRQ